MPESRADRAVRLLREAADALDEIPVRYRIRSGLLNFQATPQSIRLQADTVEAHVAEARAVLAEIATEPARSPVISQATTAGAHDDLGSLR